MSVTRHKICFGLLFLVLLSCQVLALRKNFQKEIEGIELQVDSLVVPSAFMEVDSQFWNFDELVDLVKDKAKSIVGNIKEAALDTFEGLKPIIAQKLNDFKKILAEAKAKCLDAVKKIKDQLVQGAMHLKDVAMRELPKFWKQLEGLRTKLGQARDAVVQQLMSGSLTGAAEVMNQHLNILLEEAKTAGGGLKQQLLESADILKAEAVGVVQKTLDGAKSDMLNVFSDSMKSSTVLVNQLLGEVKAQLQTGAQNVISASTGGLLSGGGGGAAEKEARSMLNNLRDSIGQKAEALVGALKTEGDDQALKVLDGLKDQVAAAAAAAKAAKNAKASGSLLCFGLVEVQQKGIESQLKELQKASGDLRDATLQATATLTERVLDTALTLGEHTGKSSQTTGAEGEGAAYEKKLESLREAVDSSAKGTIAAIEALRDQEKIKELSMRHGLELTTLVDETASLEIAKQKVEVARVNILAAMDVAVLKEIGSLKVKIFKLRDADQKAAKDELSNKEKALDAIQQLAVDATQAASQQLQACASQIAESRGSLKERVKGALANADEGSADEAAAKDGLKLLKQQVEAVWTIAVDYGSGLRAALMGAEEDLKAVDGQEDSTADQPVNVVVADIGGKLFNIMVTTRSMALTEANRALQNGRITAEDTACALCEGPEVDVCCFEWISGDAEVANEALASVALSKMSMRVRFAWENDLEPPLVHYICGLQGLEPAGRAAFAKNLRDKGVSKLSDLKETDASSMLPAGSSKVVKGILNSDREHAAAAQSAASSTAKTLMEALGERLKTQLPNSSVADSLHTAAIDKALSWEKLQQEQGIMEGDQLTERQLMDRHGMLRGMLISNKFNGEMLDVALQFDRFYSDDVLNSKVVLQPQESTTDFAQEATSKDEEASQENTIKSFGFSAAQSSTKGNSVSAGVSGGFGPFSASLSTAVSWSNSKSTSKATTSNKSTSSTSLTVENYYAKSRYILEPRQLLSVPMSMLAPTTELLEAFKKLVKQNATDVGNVKVVEEPVVDKSGRVMIDPQAAADFLYRFGSHICPRVMLGGWWRISSAVTSKASTQTLLVKQLATEAIENTMEKERSIEVKAGFSVGIPGGASVGANTGFKNTDSSASKTGSTSQEGETQEKKDARQSSVIEVHQEWKGGCSGMGPEKWRESLKFERNSNWKLVDRYLDHCVGLWTFATPEQQPAAQGLCFEWATKIMGADIAVADNLCKYRALGLVTKALEVHQAQNERTKAAPIYIKQDGGCLDYDTDQKKVVTRTCTGSDGQAWLWKDEGRLVNLGDLKSCMTYAGAPESAVTMKECGSSKGQKWSINGVGMMKSDQDDRCLEESYTNGGAVSMTTCHGRATQNWYLFGEDTKTTPKAAAVQVLWDNKCMEYQLDGGVVINTCNQGGRQRWYFSNGMLKAFADNKCATKRPGRTDSTAGTTGQLEVVPCKAGDASQKWSVFADGKWVNALDGTCLDYNYQLGASATGLVRGAPCSGLSNQQFYLEEERSRVQAKPVLFKIRRDNLCMELQACAGPSPSANDAGYDDKFRGWFDLQGCGKCNDFCRWVGNTGSGGDPSVKTVHGASFWSCRLAGSNDAYTPKDFFTSWPYPKCSIQGAAPPQIVAPPPQVPQAIKQMPCNGAATQQWKIADGKFMTSNGKCLDTNFASPQGLFMAYPCHGGNNQQFYFDGELLKNRRDDRCADYHFIHKYVYGHACHGEDNQKFYLESR